MGVLFGTLNIPDTVMGPVHRLRTRSSVVHDGQSSSRDERGWVRMKTWAGDIRRCSAGAGSSGAARNQHRKKVLPPEPKPRCHVLTSQQKCWITSSTFYTTKDLSSRGHLGIVASSRSHGSRAPESAFSSISSSFPRRAYDHGRRHSQILQPLLRITPRLCSLAVPTSSQMPMRKRVAGSEVFLIS